MKPTRKILLALAALLRPSDDRGNAPMAPAELMACYAFRRKIFAECLVTLRRGWR